MPNHVWEWLNGKSLNRFLAAGIVAFVVFRSGIWTFARNQMFPEEMESNQNSDVEDDAHGKKSEVPKEKHQENVSGSPSPYVSEGPSVSTRNSSKDVPSPSETKDDPETIGPDGIERLCKDLSVDPENVVMLVIAWKLQAETLGFFKFTEWSKGMGNLECDSTAKLQARLGSLSTILRDNPTFKKVYRYAFDFCRQSKYKVLNRDQWCNVLEFSRSILSDLSNYDEDGAWPVLMDEFVEWYRENVLNNKTT